MNIEVYHRLRFCPYCKKQFITDMIVAASDNAECFDQMGDAIVSFSYQGETYNIHSKCLTALQVSIKLSEATKK